MVLRLQIGQLSPTAATEGIQFGDDPGTRIYRSGAGVLTVSGSLIYPSATVSGTVTFPNTSNAGLTTTDGTALFRLDDIYGNIYLLNSAGGFYVDATSHNFRNASSAVGMTISSVGDVTATRYVYGTYVSTSDDVSTGNISHIMAKFGDNYHRSATAAKVAAFITGQTMNINGSSTSCSGNAATATSISGYNNPATGASANSIAYRDGNADLTTRYFMANRSSAGAGQCGVQLQTSGTTKWWMYLRQSDDNVLAFYTSNATADDVVRMSSTGLGIKVDPSNRLHVNGDGTNPAIRVDNGAVVLAASAASNSKTFYGWLPISIAGTTKWIQMYN